MSVKELIDQIGGRERLDALIDDEDFRVTVAEQELLAQIALAVLDAQQSPVWGQARFKGGEWSSCTAEHAAMVMASPDEWAGYECRYLYTAPPAASVPDEMNPEMMRAVQLKSELGAYAAANLAGAYGLFDEFWQVALSASRAPGGEQ
ncbi:hypothetical protein V6L80_00755 [Erwinia persicina]|uniref:hypothetical protein n=1 Tax=Erwinia persicina TaxID=55211 RepID=UPI0030CC2511